MITLAWIIGTVAAIFYLLTAIAFFRAKDLFTMLQVTTIANLYIVPLLLLAVEIEKFSTVSFVKTLVIILLNIVIVNLVVHLLAKRAIANKIMPDADFKKKLE